MIFTKSNNNVATLRYLFLTAAMMICAIPTLPHARYSDSFYIHVSDMSIQDIVRKGQKCQSPDTAMAYFSIAVMKHESKPEKNNTVSYINALNNAGYTALFHLDNINDAYFYLQKAAHAAQEAGDSVHLAVISLNLANVFISVDDLASASEHYLRAIRLARSVGDWQTYLTAFTGYVFQQYASGQIDNISREIPDFRPNDIPETPMREYASLIYDGIKHMENKDYGEAADLFEKSLSHINTPFTPERYPVISIYLKATALRRSGKRIEAREYLEKSLEHMPTQSRVPVYDLINRICVECGDSAAADKYRLMFLEGEKEYNPNSRQSDINGIRLDMDRKLLNQDINRLQHENKTRSIVALLCSVWAITVTILLFLFLRSNRNLKKSKKELFFKNKVIAETNNPCPAGQTLNDSTTQNTGKDEKKETLPVWEKILKVMKSTPERFSTDFSVSRLAMIVGEHPRVVSKAVNAHTGKNFSSWLTELRLDEACIRLSDTAHFGNYTISAISEGLGFKSRTHFAEVFKQHTGLSPSEFQKIARTSNKGSVQQ